MRVSDSVAHLETCKMGTLDGHLFLFVCSILEEENKGAADYRNVTELILHGVL